MSIAGRTLAGLLATGIAAAGLTVAAAVPAHATVGTVDTGSPISRTEIVERALSWTTQPVPYSESAYYPAGAPRTGVGHSYRQDCSGFVSMAWDLPGSAVTTDFVSGTSAYDTPLPSYGSLQPGDLLGTSYHTVLFLGWSADDAGRHRYFDMVSEAHSGTYASVATDQDLDGYWSVYAPYTDRLAVADVTRSVTSAAGRTDQVSLNAAGHVLYSWRTSATAAWATEDLTALHHFPILRTAPAIASAADGQLVVLGTGAGGALLEFTATGSTWTSCTLTASGTTYGIDASGSGGRIDVVGRQLGATTADGTGSFLHATLVGSAWSGWLRAASAPSSIGGDPAVADSQGAVDFVVESTAGTLLFGSWQAGVGWSWSAPFGSARVPTQPAVQRLADGTVVVLATIGGVAQQDVLLSGAPSWSGWDPQTADPYDMSALTITAQSARSPRTAPAPRRAVRPAP